MRSELRDVFEQLAVPRMRNPLLGAEKSRSSPELFRSKTIFRTGNSDLFVWHLLISFTLYPAHSRVRKGTLVLTHSVTHFSPRSGGIAC